MRHGGSGHDIASVPPCLRAPYSCLIASIGDILAALSAG